VAGVEALSHRNGSHVRSWVAVFAAYLLVVQALFAGLGAGAYANALHLDRTLALTHCAPSGEGTASGEHDKSTAHAGMGCCTAGCPMLVGGDPGQPNFRILSQRPTDLIAFVHRLDRPVGFLTDHSPRNPRAPPVALV
jgi:hypothetical protein